MRSTENKYERTEGKAYEKDIGFILENQRIQKAFYRHGLFCYIYSPVLPDLCTLLFYDHMGGQPVAGGAVRLYDAGAAEERPGGTAGKLCKRHLCEGESDGGYKDSV